jgi:hypothetical protein
MTQPHEVVTRIDQVTFSGTVLREFTAKLVDMEFTVEGGQPKSKLQFAEVQVHDCIAPYPHPAAELVMNRANRKGEVSDLGPWGALIVSSNIQGYPDLMELKGKTLRLLAHHHKIEADEKRGQSEGSFLTWEILSVDGVDSRPTIEDSIAATPASDGDPKANGTITEDQLMDLIHGKTIGEFTSAAINLSLPPSLRSRLLDKDDLIPSWLDAGKVTTDGNTYTKVG